MDLISKIANQKPTVLGVLNKHLNEIRQILAEGYTKKSDAPRFNFVWVNRIFVFFKLPLNFFSRHPNRLFRISGVRLGNCMEKYEKSLFFI